MLATMDIGWPLGADGKHTRFEPEWSFRGQAYVHLSNSSRALAVADRRHRIVLPFKASITSRSAKSKKVLDVAVEVSQASGC
jgi:hypothetical protein